MWLTVDINFNLAGFKTWPIVGLATSYLYRRYDTHTSSNLILAAC